MSAATAPAARRGGARARRLPRRPGRLAILCLSLLTLAACAGAPPSGKPPSSYGGDRYDPWRYDRAYRDSINRHWSGGANPTRYRPPVGH